MLSGRIGSISYGRAIAYTHKKHPNENNRTAANTVIRRRAPSMSTTTLQAVRSESSLGHSKLALSDQAGLGTHSHSSSLRMHVANSGARRVEQKPVRDVSTHSSAGSSVDSHLSSSYTTSVCWNTHMSPSSPLPYAGTRWNCLGGAASDRPTQPISTNSENNHTLMRGSLSLFRTVHRRRPMETNSTD